ncbi:MAG: trimethylamine methyltransferase family protein [Dehalococcoidales bacterium]
MRSNYTHFVTPQFHILSDNQIEALYYRTLEILTRTGITFDCEEAISLLGDAGADVSNPKRVKIPSFLVEKALASAPKTITLYTREGEPAMVLNRSSGAHFGTVAGVQYYLDPYSRRPRMLRVEDIDSIARLGDALPNIEWLFTVDSHQTLPGVISDKVSVLHVVMNTTKPVCASIGAASSLKEMIDICAVVAGGEERLRARPFFVSSVEPVSPLVQGKDAMEKSLLCAEKNIPNVVYSMPMCGATAPATFAGNLAVALAEILSQLVVIQLKRQGAPVICGAIANIMDMKTMINPQGAPEMGFLVAALTEVLHHYGLPVWGTVSSDAKTVGVQAATEYTYQIMLQTMAGTDFVHDVGYLQHSFMVSPEMIVYGNEIIGMVRVMMQGIEVNDETVPLDIIDKVGPGGSFLGEKHTLRHFRNFWTPNVFHRRADIDENALDCEDLLNQRTIEIMESHQPKPLPEDTVKELMKIEAGWFKRAGLKHEYPKTEWLNV